jgi:hypothetical protein
MGGDPDRVAAGFDDAAGAVAVELVGRGGDHFAAGGNRALESGVHIRDVQMQHGRRRLPAVRDFRQHDDGIADPDLAMADPAVRLQNLLGEFGIEDGGHEGNELGGALYDEVGCDGVVAVGDRFDRHGVVLCLRRRQSGGLALIRHFARDCMQGDENRAAEP